MSPDRFRAVRKLFDAACDLAPGERGRLLDERAAHDPDLRAEVERLLLQHERAGAPLDAPAWQSPDPHALIAAVPPGLERIGPFRLIRAIGHGGMGAVYEAQQESPMRRVAVKVIRADSATPEALRRFRHEADVLGRLQHPGIACIHEAGVADTPLGPRPYMAMELVRGVPVDEHARSLTGVRPRLELFARVCDAVEAAHALGIVHRDLKPSNILIDSTGAPRILDFGIARVTGGIASPHTMHTHSGQIIGTLAYMSPEQVSGQADRVTARSDVYALGVMLFELLAGRPPIDVRNLSLPDAARLLREQDPSRLSATDAALRGDPETIVLKALEKDPQRRYASAGELGADLRRYLNDQPIAARRAGRLYQLRKFARRHRELVAGVAAAFIILIAALVTVSLLAVRERDLRTLAQASEARAREATYRTAIAAAQKSLALGDAASAERALAGAPQELRHWEWAYLHARRDTSIAWYRPHRAPVVGIGINAGGWVISGAADGTLHAQQPDDSSRTWSAATGSTAIRAMALSPTRDQLLVQPADDRVELWRIGDTQPLWNAPVRGLIHRQAFSNDGAAIALPRDGTVALVDTSTGAELRTFTLPVDRITEPALDAHAALLAFRAGDFAVALDLTSGVELWRAECNGFSLESGVRPRAWLYSDWSRSAQGVDARTGARLETIDDAPGLVAHHSPPRVLTHGETGALMLRECPTGRSLAAMAGHTEPITTSCFSPDGQTAAAGASDGSVRLWRTDHAPQSHFIEGSNDAMLAAWASSDGARALTAGWGGVKFWDLSLGVEQQTIFPLLREVRALVADSSGETLSAIGLDGVVAVIDTRNARVRRTSPPLGARLLAGAWRESTRSIICSAEDGRVFDVSHESLAASGISLSAHSPVDAMAVSADSSHLALSDRDGRVWLVRSAQPADPFAATDADLLRTAGQVRAVRLAFDPHSAALAAGHTDGSVALWDCADRTARWTVTRSAPAEARALAFSPDGARLAVGYSDSWLRIIDTASGEVLLQFRAAGSGVSHLQFTEAGRTLVAVLGGPRGGIEVYRTTGDVLTMAHRFHARIRRLVAQRFESLHFAGDVARSIEADATLSDAERQAALQQVRARGDHPNFLNSQAWAVVRQPGSSPADIDLALRKARLACDLRPGLYAYINTLGVALLRAGLWAEAEATISRAISLHTSEHGAPHPLDLAARAVALHGLGQSALARAELERAAPLLLQPPYRDDEECRLFLSEAQALLQGPTPR